MTTAEPAATEPTYQITTSVDGAQEWPAETIVAGSDYTLGEDLGAVCERLAATAHENTEWIAAPASVRVAIVADPADPDRYELASGTFTFSD